MNFLGMLIFVILFLLLMNHMFAFVAKCGEKATDVIEGKKRLAWDFRQTRNIKNYHCNCILLRNSLYTIT